MLFDHHGFILDIPERDYFIIGELSENILHEISRPVTILDIGAHVGSWSLMAASLGSDRRIVAVEPDESNFISLANNISNNGLKDRIIPIRAALWHERRAIELKRPRLGNSGQRSLVFRDGYDSCGFVNGVVFSELLDLFPDGVDYCKIDIEAAEWSIIPKIEEKDLSRVKIFEIDVHETLPEYTPDDYIFNPDLIHNHLESRGFAIEAMTRGIIARRS